MMNIRRANCADLDAIERIYDEVHEAEELGVMTIGWARGVYPTRRTAEEAIHRGDMFVLEEDKILGAAIINRTQVDVYCKGDWEYDSDAVCVLHTLVIAPREAGKGYGRGFVKYYEQWAEAHDLPELRIDTNARNLAARSMYRKLGYKEIGIVPTTFNGIPGVDLVLLEKNLGGGKLRRTIMSTITIKKISITDLATDAIVNAANDGLWAGGGVCGAIFRAAGHAELQAACNKIGGCPTGSAVITPGFKLKAKYIIHAVGPVWQGGMHKEPELLYSAYYKSLELAAANHCRSIGFPLISSGIFGYPLKGAWQQALSACRDYLDEHSDVEMDIVFAVLSDQIIKAGYEVLEETGDTLK